MLNANILDYTHALKGKGVEIVLPINQHADPLLRLRSGKCYGYTVYWGKCLMEGIPPFGIRPDLPSPFNYIPGLPENQQAINQLGRLYRGHSLFRFHNYQHWRFLGLTGTNLVSEECTSVGMAITNERWANQLINLVNKYPGKTINLSIFSVCYANTGHSIGIHKTPDGNIHFLDCVYGWFRFKNENAFKEWFPVYVNLTWPDVAPYYQAHVLHPTAQVSALKKWVGVPGMNTLRLIGRILLYPLRIAADIVIFIKNIPSYVRSIAAGVKEIFDIIKGVPPENDQEAPLLANEYNPERQPNQIPSEEKENIVLPEAFPKIIALDDTSDLIYKHSDFKKLHSFTLFNNKHKPAEVTKTARDDFDLSSNHCYRF